MSSGFVDKLYWRWPTDYEAHCFKRVTGGGFESLCKMYAIKGVQTQICGRPPLLARCGNCDDIEQHRRRVSSPMPEEKDYRRRHYQAINFERISNGRTLEDYLSSEGPTRTGE
jgi:hypothetical protein